MQHAAEDVLQMSVLYLDTLIISTWSHHAEEFCLSPDLPLQTT